MKKSNLNFKRTTPVVLTTLLVVCCAFLQTAQAVSPPPGGGYDNANNVNGTPHWSSAFTIPADAGLIAQSAVYDQATNTMIVFGGVNKCYVCEGTNAVVLNAPATGSGVWSTLIANGAPGSPPARDLHSAVYDSVNNRMIIFGGEVYSTGATLNDVWVLSNANGQGGPASWTQLNPSGSLPTARLFHSAVYDAANNIMTVFGGQTSNFQPLTDVWVLSHANGLGGTPAWTQLSPGGRLPSGVFGHTAVYDASNNIMIVFAGINAANTSTTNGVYALSHANGLGGTPQWSKILGNGTAGSPAKRLSPTAVYDAANNRMTIFGGSPNTGNNGLPGGGEFNDVWVLANANGLGTPVWTQLHPTGGPVGTRVFHTAVYDAVNNLMVIYGGDNYEAVYFDTWVLSDANGL
jgi:hypothetical protein